MSLSPENQLILKNMLVTEEGFRQFPYRCSAGKLTIGIGRNLEANGVSMQEALLMLENDTQYFIEQLNKKLPYFKCLDPIRQMVLIDMAFNLGINNLLQFKKTLQAIEQANYTEAAKEMLNSKWAIQVGKRALRLAKMMESGQYHELN